MRDLLDLIARDFPDHRLERAGPGRANLVPHGAEVQLEVAMRVERRFLGRTAVAIFGVRVPRAGGREVQVRFRHTGNLRRGGLVAISEEPDGLVMGRRLLADEGFATPARNLDFTRFELTGANGEWRAETELMGASLVTIVFPPVRNYVRLHPDQRQALLASLGTLSRVLTVP